MGVDDLFLAVHYADRYNEEKRVGDATVAVGDPGDSPARPRRVIKRRRSDPAAETRDAPAADEALPVVTDLEPGYHPAR
jgi:hypothetical protein